MPDDLDALLDELPPSLALKVARALAPDADDLEPPDDVEVKPYLESPGPCPVSWRYEPVDSDLLDLLK